MVIVWNAKNGVPIRSIFNAHSHGVAGECLRRGGATVGVCVCVCVPLCASMAASGVPRTNRTPPLYRIVRLRPTAARLGAVQRST
jgi:hypothetical protein